VLFVNVLEQPYIISFAIFGDYSLLNKITPY